MQKLIDGGIVETQVPFKPLDGGVMDAPIEQDEKDLLTKMMEGMDQEAEEERLREADPLGAGRWAILQGLQADQFNGRSFEIIQKQNSEGRVGVRTHEGDKLFKSENLQPFAGEVDERKIIKVARIGARGEETGSKGPGGVRTWHWPQKVLDTLPSEVSPISVLIGIPLNVTKVEPHSKLEGEDALDNFYASEFMVWPETGLALLPWQRFVGPVIVWRSGGEPFSADDACLVHDFIHSLLDISKGEALNQEAITPDVFQEFKRIKLEEEQQSPYAEKSHDVNI